MTIDSVDGQRNYLMYLSIRVIFLPMTSVQNTLNTLGIKIQAKYLENRASNYHLRY